jgi:hypothetical protein
VAQAQRHQLTINAETPEGALLQQIGQESDDAKKLTLMEDFASKFPKHEGAPWVYEQMIAGYNKTSQWDKTLAACDKLLAVDPEDAVSAHACLKAAEGKKDGALVKVWAGRTSDVARKVVASPKPADEDEAEAWKSRVDFAKQLDVYTEYSLFAAALAATDPQVKIELANALETRNPQSQYVPQLQNQMFSTYVQMKDLDKAVAIADKAIAANANNEEMLLVAADYYFNKKQADKAVPYATKVVEVLNSKQKPEGVADADWQKRKDTMIGHAHWIVGVSHGIAGRYLQSDQALRAALPLVKDDSQRLAGALFYLGLANYRLGDQKSGVNKDRILDALRFNQQCAAIKSPYQAQAQKNIAAIRSQFHIK